MEENNIVSEEVRVKNEPICYSQSISQTKKAIKVKEEPLDIEVKAEIEEKYSASEEFANKTSIAFLSEETMETSNNNQKARTISNKTNRLQKSK